MQGWYCWLCSSRCVSFTVVVRPLMLRHQGRYEPEGQVCSMRVWPRSSSNAAVACFELGLLVTMLLTL